MYIFDLDLNNFTTGSHCVLFVILMTAKALVGARRGKRKISALKLSNGGSNH